MPGQDTQRLSTYPRAAQEFGNLEEGEDVEEELVAEVEQGYGWFGGCHGKPDGDNIIKG